MSSLFATLPPNVQAKAEEAFAQAFPGAEIQSLTPLHGGLSGAVVYKAVVDDRSVVLRIIDGINAFNNPMRQFTCMTLAAQQGVAPEVYFTDAELGVSITAWVEQQPFRPALQGDDQVIARCSEVLRRLHTGPAFPVFPDIFEMITMGCDQLAQRGVNLPPLLATLLAEFAVVREALEPHLILAPSHNDLNPGNILYDGQRIWIIDWEGASMGDPIFDLASFIHWFGFNPAQETVLLTAYFERAPTAFERAKLKLMKQVSWCFHAIIFLLFSFEGEGPHTVAPVDPEELPTFLQALRAIGMGELRLQEAAARQRLSLIVANQALNDMRQPAFSEALNELKAKS